LPSFRHHAGALFDKGRDAYIFDGGEFGKQMVELENKTDMLVAESDSSFSFIPYTFCR